MLHVTCNINVITNIKHLNSSYTYNILYLDILGHELALKWILKGTLQDLENIDCACLLASQQPTKDVNWNSYYNINSKQVFHFINKDIKQLINM